MSYDLRMKIEVHINFHLWTKKNQTEGTLMIMWANVHMMQWRPTAAQKDLYVASALLSQKSHKLYFLFFLSRLETTSEWGEKSTFDSACDISFFLLLLLERHQSPSQAVDTEKMSERRVYCEPTPVWQQTPGWTSPSRRWSSAVFIHLLVFPLGKISEDSSQHEIAH